MGDGGRGEGRVGGGGGGRISIVMRCLIYFVKKCVWVCNNFSYFQCIFWLVWFWKIHYNLGLEIIFLN